MRAITNGTLRNWLEDSPYQSYAYGYPHKTAYRALVPPVPLSDAWAGEDKRHLYLYVHVPFCEMRCGFCNLFTTTHPESGLVGEWLSALLRQARTMRDLLGDGAAFARGAIGGGTPTFLETGELRSLLSGLRELFGPGLAGTPFSVEMSPATVSAEKLLLLREYGMHRASLGVQSFLEEEVRAAGRGQKASEVDRALKLMAASGVAVRNLDLIYGIPGQTSASWQTSLECAVRHAPEEIYLYPLYVRPLTGLGRLRREPGDNRSDLYAQARDFLGERGYRQLSLRLFRAHHAPALADPPYVCQEDGMVGLGPGARSYTQALHYSSDYAVGAGNIGQIIREFVMNPDFSQAHHGVWLDGDEQRRRYLIKSLLRTEGIERASYQGRFGRDAEDEWMALFDELAAENLLRLDANSIQLTQRGIDLSDTIGPWLYSEAMSRKMDEYAWS